VKLIHKIIIITLIVSLLGGGVVYAFRDSLFGAKTSSPTAKKIPLIAKNVNLMDVSAVTKAADTALYGNNDSVGAVSLYDAAIQTSLENKTSTETLAGLYLAKAIFLLDQKDYTNALQVGGSLEALVPSADSAYVLAESYAGMGDKSHAIEKFKVAISRVKPIETTKATTNNSKNNQLGANTSPSNAQKAGYQTRIDELQ
jgi:tetratricopeptide (TPR) repeat protein